MMKDNPKLCSSGLMHPSNSANGDAKFLDKSCKRSSFLTRWLLAATLLLACNMSGWAQSGYWTDYGIRDVTWEGKGTAAEPYLIYTANELGGFAYIVNGDRYGLLNGAYIKLERDIDLGGRGWEPIGFWETGFAFWYGTFDGNGHTIKNMTVYNSGDLRENGAHNGKGLFGYFNGPSDPNDPNIGSSVISSVIKNLIIENPIIENAESSTSWAGPVIGAASRSTITMQNVHVRGGVVRGVFNTGGMVGGVNIGTTLTMERCSSNADVDPATITLSVSNNRAGGLVGNNEARVNMFDCEYFGRLWAGSDNFGIGGIYGYVTDEMAFNNASQTRPVLMGGYFDACYAMDRGAAIGTMGNTAINHGTPWWYLNKSCYTYSVGNEEVNLYVYFGSMDLWGAPNDNWYGSGGNVRLKLPAGPPVTGASLTWNNANSVPIAFKWNSFKNSGYDPAYYLYVCQPIEIGWLYRIDGGAWCEPSSIIASGSYGNTIDDALYNLTIPGEVYANSAVSHTMEITIKRNKDSWSSDRVGNSNRLVIPPFGNPKNLTIEPKPLENCIQLQWTMPRITDGNTPISGYSLQVNTGSGWADVPQEDVIWSNKGSVDNGYGNLDYNPQITQPAIKVKYPITGQGVKTIKYRIKRAFAPWAANAEVSNDFQAYALKSNVNTNSALITGIGTGEASTDGIALTWTQDNGWLNTEWYFRLYRKFTTDTKFEFDSPVDSVLVKDIVENSIMDSTATSCISYDYIIRLEEGDAGSARVIATSPVMNNHDVVRLPAIKGKIETLSVSKGYYNDRVDVNFTVTRNHSFTRLAVYRTRYNTEGATTQNIKEFDISNASASTTDYSFTDNTAIPGIYYNYEVKAFIDCSGKVTEGSNKASIGFIQPFGIVSGQITYEGGTAVQGVAVVAENDASSQYANRAIRFDRDLQTQIATPYKEGMLSPEAFSWQAWVMVSEDSKGAQPLMNAAGKYSIRVDNDIVVFSAYQGTDRDYIDYKFDNRSLAKGVYNHITISYTNSADVGTAIFYLNGEAVDTVVQNCPLVAFPKATAADSVIYTGRNKPLFQVAANIDDMCEWGWGLQDINYQPDYVDMSLQYYYFNRSWDPSTPIGDQWLGHSEILASTDGVSWSLVVDLDGVRRMAMEPPFSIRAERAYNGDVFFMNSNNGSEVKVASGITEVSYNGEQPIATLRWYHNRQGLPLLLKLTHQGGSFYFMGNCRGSRYYGPYGPDLLLYSDTYLDGYMDEVRMWNKALDATTVANNYNANLTGKEQGLMLYYRFDEPIDDQVFDVSGRNGIFNENHGKLTNGKSGGIPPTRTIDNLPPCYNKAVTDADGNYLISTIPYTGEGSNVKLRPMLGVHTFNPPQKPLFFNQNATTYSNVDFIDNSSFKVKGFVYYSNSNYPVEGVTLKVDNSVATKDGEPIMTKADGSYEINVPIGKHSISVEKTGHSFDVGGRFPAYDATVYNQRQHEFIDSLSGITFYDNTHVTIVGRVVGGDIEREKQLGFGLSKANIGAATVVLKNTNTAAMFSDATCKLALGNGDTITSTLKSKQGEGTFVTIVTDSATGEFIVSVPPIKFDVANVSTKEFNQTPDDFSYSTKSLNPDVTKTATLALRDTSGYVPDSLVVHDSLQITRYNKPQMSVIDRHARQGAFGDSVYYYASSSVRDTIRLYEAAGSGVDYNYGYPVFSNATHVYTWGISVYELYKNIDKGDGDNAVYDTVPKRGLQIQVDNGLASYQVLVDTTKARDTTILTSNNDNIILGDDGRAEYSFQTGFPNISGDKLLAVAMNYSIAGMGYTWEPYGDGRPFKAYLLGEVPSAGSNFITMGPDHVDIVLHDPPSSYGFATLEKGSSVTYTNEKTSEATASDELSLTVHMLPKFEMSIGFFGVSTSVETKPIADLSLATSGSQTHTAGNRATHTIEFNKSVSTSADPEMVGSKADVYIGASTNLTFGQVRRLTFYPPAECDPELDPTPVGGAGAKYQLFTKEKVSTDQEFTTIFNYTQDYIVNTQIPNIKNARNSLIESVTAYPTTINWGDARRLYYSKLERDDPDFGKAGTYTVYYAPDASAAEKVDEVSAYNRYIKSWEERIMENERDKSALFDKHAKAKDVNVVENYSFDGGTGELTNSMAASYENVDIQSVAVSSNFTLSETGGFLLNDAGIETTLTVSEESALSDASENAKASTLTFAYTLADDPGDALTVDVYQPITQAMKNAVQLDKISTLHSYIFQTRAGQTSCPYEGSDSTLYFRKDGKPVILNQATFMAERPDMYINGNRSATAGNVPSESEATFSLTLQNLSDSKQTKTYALSVDPSTNPDGLIISVDGTPLTTPREYTLDFNQNLKVTLKVRQSSLDILDYENVKLNFGSTCDEIAAEAMLSVHYIPSSPSSRLEARQTLVNLTGNLAGTASNDTVQFILSEYDRNFRNFADLQLQYKSVNATIWETAKAFVYYNQNNVTLSDFSKGTDSIKGPSITCDYDMTALTDGVYDFRILSRAKYGTGYVSVPSNEVRIIKDVNAPKLFGNPSPATGIYTAGSEISVTYNEDISNLIFDDLTQFSNITVKALKNGSKVAHDAAVMFAGGAPAATEASIGLNGTSFMFEMFVRRTPGTAGTLLAHGNNLSIGISADNKLVVNIMGETLISTGLIDKDAWYYLTLAYNDTKGNGNGAVQAFAFTGATTVPLKLQDVDEYILPTKYTGSGRLFVGAKADGTDAFTGNIHELSLWSNLKYQYHSQETKAGNETGLIGYWQMNEAHGTVAADKVRARNLVLPSENMWYSPVGNYAAKFTGSDSYVAMDATNLNIAADNDFTLEFWFHGAPQADTATLFSMGDGVRDVEPDKKLSIAVNPNGSMALRSNGVENVISSHNCLNNVWHHFALNVLRSGSTIAYIDGEAVAQLPHTAIANMMGDTMLIGALDYRTKEARHNYGNYFNGSIDELRIWKAGMTGGAIRQNIYNQLSGDEPGLVAYYPFNETVYGEQNIITTAPSLRNFAKSAGKHDATAAAHNATTDEQAPVIKPTPLLQNVEHNYVANNNKIIVNITDAPSLIENTTLDINVHGIQDLNGNASNNIHWTVFVQQNRLKWSDEAINLAKAYLTEETFEVTIANLSGKEDNWTISNLPSWLTASATSGTLEPTASARITFTIAESTPIGSYDEVIYLSGTNGINEPLGISLKVVGELPDWTVNPADFELSMSLIGKLQFEGKVSEDSEDKVAAFIDGVCVGVASPAYYSRQDAFYVMMDIYAHNIPNWSGKTVSFKAWDASTGVIYPAVSTGETAVKFVANNLYGSMSAPIILNGEAKTEQQIALSAGWNWISFNTRPSDMKVSSMFNDIAKNMNVVKDARVFTNNSWNGGLTDASIGKMYKLNMFAPDRLVVIGDKLDPTRDSITIAAGGWSWIGYTTTFSLPLQDALADLEPSEGDLIKGQSQFSVYTGGQWLGSLKTMAPGRGYLYQSKSSAEKKFAYPATSVATASSFVRSAAAVATVFTPVAETIYSGNMSIIAIVKDGTTQLTNVEVGIFAGNECRGTALASADGRYYISVAGDDAIDLTIKVIYDGQTLTPAIPLSYNDDAIIGSSAEPFVIQLGEDTPTGIDDAETNDRASLQAYPNPTSGELRIRSYELRAGDVIEMYNAAGQRVAIFTATGPETKITVEGLAAGTYVVRIARINASVKVVVQ